MSQQYFKYEPKPSMYDQINSLPGVVEVELFEFEAKGAGFLVIGGSDEDISEAIGMHTYTWNRDWLVGDTECKREFFTARWFRNYYKFNAKREELSK